MSRNVTKRSFGHAHPTKTQISLRICAVWSVFAVRMKKLCFINYPKCLRLSVKILIRLRECAGWSEFSLGTYLKVRFGLYLSALWYSIVIEHFLANITVNRYESRQHHFVSIYHANDTTLISNLNNYRTSGHLRRISFSNERHLTQQCTYYVNLIKCVKVFPLLCYSYKLFLYFSGTR